MLNNFLSSGDKERWPSILEWVRFVSIANICLFVGVFAWRELSVNHQTRLFWVVVALCGAIYALYRWQKYYRIKQVLSAMPISRVAYAAQGYGQFYGVGQSFAEQRTLSPFTGLPCLWYHYKVYKETDNKKHLVHEVVSSDTFFLIDKTGCCVVSPSAAQVLTCHTDSFVRDYYCYEERLLLAQDKLFVLGAFSTQANLDNKATLHHALTDKLSEWKQNKAFLLQRFDVEGKGELSQTEWERVREAAEQEVQAEFAPLQSGYHLLEKPANSFPFIVANTTPETISVRYARAANIALSIAIFLLLGGLLFLAFGRGLSAFVKLFF